MKVIINTVSTIVIIQLFVSKLICNLRDSIITYLFYNQNPVFSVIGLENCMWTFFDHCTLIGWNPQTQLNKISLVLYNNHFNIFINLIKKCSFPYYNFKEFLYFWISSSCYINNFLNLFDSVKNINIQYYFKILLWN